jgi:uncharacterized Zn finger protein
LAKKEIGLFINLSWDGLRKWAGSKIVSRGRSYQRQKLVSKLAILDDEGLIAWVDGTHRYATRVTIDEEGLPDSICTCPYGYDCKHGVAVVLEYLEQIEKDKRIPKASKDDERLLLFDEEEWDDDLDDQSEKDCDESSLTGTTKSEINAYLNGKTKAQLTELVHELAGKFPQITQELMDRKQIASGDVKSLIKRLKKDIREISYEPGWQNHWQGEGYTPDYSEIRMKLESLLKSGHADEVVALGKELIELGNHQVEQSHDDGETAMEIEECMPIIIESLDQSSMDKADKLAWAVDVALKDDYGIFDAFCEYLYRRHAKADWNILADRLLKQLGKMKHPNGHDSFHRNYARDRLSDLIIHALECAGRKEEIIPLCEAEAPRTGSFTRLVKHLISAKRHADAERWIQEGIRATERQLPGIASDLRNNLKEIRISQKNWPIVVVMQTEKFVRYPSQKTFTECQKANAKTWPLVRKHLLVYLEEGTLPWKQKGWPLPKSNQTMPETSYRNQFPMASVLIDIAILEKKPERVLFWYDQFQKGKKGRAGVNDNKIAVAIQDFAPERAVSIWKTMAESLIDRVKPSAYEQAAGYLRKAEKIVKREKKQAEWNQYLNELKSKHARKRRLIEILDQSNSLPIIGKRR